MNDVYSGDDGLGDGVKTEMPQQAFSYRIFADANPDVLLRVASQLLLSNLAPYKLTMNSVSADSVEIKAELRGLRESTAESIRRKLLQLSCVETVEIRGITESA